MSARSMILAAAVAALVVAGCGSSTSKSSTTSGSAATTSSSTTATQTGFERVAIEQGQDLAPASTTQTGTVDGIQCGSTEQLAYHIHAHLQVYVNGAARSVPGGIGIPGSQVVSSAEGPVAQGGQCIYWLHTHAPDGIVHIESPTHRVYTLGNFFDEWHQPLSSTQVSTASGKVTAFVNGKPWTKNPRDIPLDPHAVIQLSVGTPVVAFKSLSWAATQL